MTRCVLCGSNKIQTSPALGRFVTAACRACGATVRVEFDPPNEPGLAGRIDVLVEPRRVAIPFGVPHPPPPR